MERNSTPLAAQEVEEEEDETVNNSRRTCELELPVLLKGMLLNCCFHHHTLLRFQLSVLHTLQVHPEGKAILSAVIAASGSIPKHLESKKKESPQNPSSYNCIFFFFSVNSIRLSSTTKRQSDSLSLSLSLSLSHLKTMVAGRKKMRR
jgi:hypothetical protein